MVCNTPELRQAHEQQQAAVVRFSSRLGQSKAIYRALKQLSTADDQLTPAAAASCNRSCWAWNCVVWGSRAPNKNISTPHRRTHGIEHPLFQQRADATASWELLLSSPEEMDGCPDSLRELLADSARRKGHEQATAADGPWLMGFDYPRYGPFCNTAAAGICARVYRGFISRPPAVSTTTAICWQISPCVNRRPPCWATATGPKSSASKMAPSVQAVETLLEDLRAPSHAPLSRS